MESNAEAQSTANNANAFEWLINVAVGGAMWIGNEKGQRTHKFQTMSTVDTVSKETTDMENFANGKLLITDWLRELAKNPNSLTGFICSFFRIFSICLCFSDQSFVWPLEYSSCKAKRRSTQWSVNQFHSTCSALYTCFFPDSIGIILSDYCPFGNSKKRNFRRPNPLDHRNNKSRNPNPKLDFVEMYVDVVTQRHRRWLE